MFFNRLTINYLSHLEISLTIPLNYHTVFHYRSQGYKSFNLKPRYNLSCKIIEWLLKNSKKYHSYNCAWKTGIIWGYVVAFSSFASTWSRWYFSAILLFSQVMPKNKEFYWFFCMAEKEKSCRIKICWKYVDYVAGLTFWSQSYVG